MGMANNKIHPKLPTNVYHALKKKTILLEGYVTQCNAIRKVILLEQLACIMGVQNALGFQSIQVDFDLIVYFLSVDENSLIITGTLYF